MSTNDWYDLLMSNDILKNLPEHLKQYIIDQDYDGYTAIDQAIWRYVMQQSRSFLQDHAHKIYMDGLEQTGLETNSIPSIHQMNKILSKIGWAAVTVNGFIPPAAFMEFQAHKVLVIAADIRQLHHIEYTPSPDIIHEAAGHAPIIADPEYADYLKLFGEIGSKAMSSRMDMELYEAIRKLSILKEAPDADPQEIDEAEKMVVLKQKNLGKPSEMALLSRLHWWTVEYGLVGEMNEPKIYGAGLLSSIGESVSCLTNEVKKIPYSLDAVTYAFDITTKQPQLFVTPNFRYLRDVLQEFAKTMAFQKGGMEGIQKAIESTNTATIVYTSGLQVSGTVTEVIYDEWNRPVYIKTTGPSNLAYNNVQLEGHGKNYHKDGFSSPVGILKNAPAPMEGLSDAQLLELGINVGEKVILRFESGLMVDGHLDNILRQEGSIILMTFSQCSVNLGEKVFFQPGWGTYDMAVGEKIVSVFSGAADKNAFEQPSKVSQTRTIKVEYDDNTKRLQQLYEKVRKYRNDKTNPSVLTEVSNALDKSHQDDWLLRMELLEIYEAEGLAAAEGTKQALVKLADKNKENNKLINDGLNLLYGNRE